MLTSRRGSGGNRTYRIPSPQKNKLTVPSLSSFLSLSVTDSLTVGVAWRKQIMLQGGQVYKVEKTDAANKPWLVIFLQLEIFQKNYETFFRDCFFLTIIMISRKMIFHDGNKRRWRKEMKLWWNKQARQLQPLSCFVTMHNFLATISRNYGRLRFVWCLLSQNLLHKTLGYQQLLSRTLILRYASLFILIFVPVNFLLIYNFCKRNLIELR